MFKFLILLKMINYLGRYAAPKLHPAILIPVRGCDQKMSLEAEVNLSKWLNRDGTKNWMWISSILTR